MTGMLDEADFIAKYDKKNMLELIGQQLDLVDADLDVIGKLTAHGIGNVVLVTGEPGVPAEFVQDWLEQQIPVPVQIVHGHELPRYAGKYTLAVVGTLEAMAGATAVGAQIVVVSASERLLSLARERNWPSVVLPGHAVPRLEAISGILALGAVFEALGWARGLRDELKACAEAIRPVCERWAPSVPTRENIAKQIAQELVGHPVVVYAGPTMRALALKWKIDLNERAHQLAFCTTPPWLNQSELSSWERPRSSGIKVVELRSDLDSERINESFELANRLLSNRFAPLEVRPEGSKLEQMVWTWMLGSYVSAYLGMLNQIDLGEASRTVKAKQGDKL
jgi:glucose/mannose-6-phosphate isomerase